MVSKFKILIFGDGGVGKTTFVNRYLTGVYTTGSITIGVDFHIKLLEIDGDEITLRIWDFAGEQKFRILFPSYVSGASGALVLYDITNKESLYDLESWINIIDNVESPPRTRILIEHKIDLEDQRVVTRKEANKFHKKYNFQGEIIGASAKTGENVEDVFQILGREILKNSLRKCPNCGNHYPLELKFCQYCGTKTY